MPSNKIFALYPVLVLFRDPGKSHAEGQLWKYHTKHVECKNELVLTHVVILLYISFIYLYSFYFHSFCIFFKLDFYFPSKAFSSIFCFSWRPQNDYNSVKLLLYIFPLLLFSWYFNETILPFISLQLQVFFFFFWNFLGSRRDFSDIFKYPFFMTLYLISCVPGFLKYDFVIVVFSLFFSLFSFPSLVSVRNMFWSLALVIT